MKAHSTSRCDRGGQNFDNTSIRHLQRRLGGATIWQPQQRLQRRPKGRLVFCFPVKLLRKQEQPMLIDSCKPSTHVVVSACSCAQSAFRGVQWGLLQPTWL